MKTPYANTPEHFRSSWPAHHAVPRLRRSRAINARRAFSICAAMLAVLVPLRTPAATPAQKSTPQPRIRVDVTKIQPKALLPKHAEHTEFVVEINKLGQVTRIRSHRDSDSASFNAQTMGNAMQAFIRTPDGHVVLGTYRLTYDYNPKTTRVRRDVSLVSQGGVNPDAKGAAVVLMEKAHGAAAPRSTGSIDPRNLPDLKSISAPAAQPTSHERRWQS